MRTFRARLPSPTLRPYPITSRLAQYHRGPSAVAADLFFVPGTAPFDGTVQNKVNTIIKEELESAGVEIPKKDCQVVEETAAYTKATESFL